MLSRKSDCNKVLSKPTHSRGVEIIMAKNYEGDSLPSNAISLFDIQFVIYLYVYIIKQRYLLNFVFLVTNKCSIKFIDTFGFR